MGGWFSSSKKKKREEVSSQDKAILELKRQRDRLKKYSIKLDEVIAREQQIAIALLKEGKKDRAMLALRKKKYQTKTLEDTENHMLNLEKLVNTIKFSQMQNEVFASLKQGTEALNKINAEISLEEVEQLMDDTAEAYEYQDKLNVLLQGELSTEDDDAVLAELAAIEQEEADALELPDAPQKPVLEEGSTPGAVVLGSSDSSAMEVEEADQKEEEAVLA